MKFGKITKGMSANRKEIFTPKFRRDEEKPIIKIVEWPVR